MKIKFYIIGLLLTGNEVMAQLPEDALRMSWITPLGSARNQAIGGAMGSLGGEISALYVNPAGLGLYKTSEFVVTPLMGFYNSKGSFRGTDAKADALSRFNLGMTGFVFGWSDPGSRWSSKAFSIGINRTANFNSRVHYKGLNDFSSFTEAAAEEFARSGYDIEVYPLYNTNLSLGTMLANATYLIDTLTINGRTEIVGTPQRYAIKNGTTALLSQERTVSTKGGVTEIALGLASNMDDKLYLGASLGIPIVNYQRSSTFIESDATGLTDNDFQSATYQEDYSAKGVGFNAKLGLIFKTSEFLRFGVAIHTPSLYALKEKTTASMVANIEKFFSETRPILLYNTDSVYTQFGQNVPQYKYDLVSPWKFMVSASYVLHQVEDVSQQRGFITADIEYVTHGSSRFSSGDEQTADDYYDAVNAAIKDSYKGAFNFRVGGELKFNTIMTRLGFAYYGNPYKDKELKAQRMNLSGGLGYRNKGIFIDLTYVQNLIKDVNFPYRLGDKANTFANIKESNGNVLLTLGFKL